MPTWNKILNDARSGNVQDQIRRKYIKNLCRYTGRNAIVYYSAWLDKEAHGNALSISDADINGLMAVINGMDRSKGLDLVLHTPGGNVAATEAIVSYLRSCFKTDIRAVIPQIAMSAGTMIACSCRQIIMGRQSSIGPIDPQFNGLPAHAILEEFQLALASVQANQASAPIWQQVIAKYPPTTIIECKQAIDWSEDLVRQWLKTGMLHDDPDRNGKAEAIVKVLGSHATTKSHNRHVSASSAHGLGLKIVDMESDQKLQDHILSIHHATMITFSTTKALKIIENQSGKSWVIAG